jgi:hypothetical protein
MMMVMILTFFGDWGGAGGGARGGENVVCIVERKNA